MHIYLETTPDQAAPAVRTPVEIPEGATLIIVLPGGEHYQLVARGAHTLLVTALDAQVGAYQTGINEVLIQSRPLS